VQRRVAHGTAQGVALAPEVEQRERAGREEREAGRCDGRDDVDAEQAGQRRQDEDPADRGRADGETGDDDQQRSDGEDQRGILIRA
jgi:hypothetical protein